MNNEIQESKTPGGESLERSFDGDANTGGGSDSSPGDSQQASNPSPATGDDRHGSGGDEFDFEFAPHGRDETGKPLAPYGWTLDRKTKLKRVKKQVGRVDPPKTERDDHAALNAAIGWQAGPTSPDPGGSPSGVAAKQKFEVHVTGAMFLFMLDAIVPGAISLLYNAVSSDKVESKSLKMTPEDKQDLEKISDAVVGDLLGALTPLQQFALMLSLMYASKLTYAPKLAKVKKGKEPPPSGEVGKEDKKKGGKR